MTNDLFAAGRRLSGYAQALLTACVVAMVAGCASGPRAVLPVPLIITIKANPDMNPDSRGRPSPVKAVIYELKSPAAFEAADFFSLSQKDQASIGADLLGREEVFLRPGETKILTRKGFPDTTVVGVFVEFRDIEKSVWRATAPIPTAETGGLLSSVRGGPRDRSFQITLERGGVRIAALATSTKSSAVAPALPASSSPTVSSLGAEPPTSTPTAASLLPSLIQLGK